MDPWPLPSSSRIPPAQDDLPSRHTPVHCPLLGHEQGGALGARVKGTGDRVADGAGRGEDLKVVAALQAGGYEYKGCRVLRN